jgi:acylphosphatase
MPIAKRIVYSGQVQGVGFRYTARRTAERFPVAGWVRNLPDGRVELLAEGEEGDVDAFLEALADRMGGYIDRAEVKDETPGGLKGFDVRH